MFSPYKKTDRVAYFGEWAEDGAAQAPKVAALNVLWNAVERASEEDCRTAAVYEALDFLHDSIRKKHPATAFRAALDVPDPQQRIKQLRDAHFRIARECGLYSGRLL